MSLFVLSFIFLVSQSVSAKQPYVKTERSIEHNFSSIRGFLRSFERENNKIIEYCAKYEYEIFCVLKKGRAKNIYADIDLLIKRELPLLEYTLQALKKNIETYLYIYYDKGLIYKARYQRTKKGIGYNFSSIKRLLKGLERENENIMEYCGKLESSCVSKIRNSADHMSIYLGSLVKKEIPSLERNIESFEIDLGIYFYNCYHFSHDSWCPYFLKEKLKHGQ